MGISDIDARTLTRSEKDDVLERDGYICQYCGCDADSVDHIIPWSHCHDNSPFNLVAACMICNSVAGNRVFDTFLAKKNHVITRRLQMLARRAVPIWMESEVAELTGRMRDMIISDCIIVKDHRDGLEIARRLAEDGFSVTFGDGKVVGLDDLVSAIEAEKERAEKRRIALEKQNRAVVGNMVSAVCQICGIGFSYEKNKFGRVRKYCHSASCRTIREARNKAKKAAEKSVDKKPESC